MHIRIIINTYNGINLAVAKFVIKERLLSIKADGSYRMLPYMYDFVIAGFTFYTLKRFKIVANTAKRKRL